MPSAVVLASADDSLIATLRGAVSKVPGLDLEVAHDPPAVERSLRHQGSVLVAHLDAQRAPSFVTDLICRAIRAPRSIPALVICDLNRPEQTLEFLQHGAVEVLHRPLDLVRLTFFLDVLTLRARVGFQALPEVASAPEVHRVGPLDSFIYSAGPMESLMQQVRMVASTDASVLLLGETGVGKTELARVIHELSPRSTEPLITVHCAALSPSLIESELFGHVRGSFTGAERDRRGKLDEAGEGSVLLDDVDTLPMPLQAKLLRVVEERSYEQVGADCPRRLRARLMSASNRPLEQCVASGTFRADLYYRLNVVQFTLPPLRQRREVIVPIAERFLHEFAGRNQRPAPSFNSEVERALQHYDWPGNVRQLRNVVEGAVALCSGSTIDVGLLPEPLRHSVGGATPAQATSLRQATQNVEREQIVSALQKHKDNRLRAARELGISRVTFYKKLHRYGLI